jgi:hypothetical protein
MLYHFQPILTHFAVRGTILSYISGSSRTDSNDETDCLGRPASALLYRTQRPIRTGGLVREVREKLEWS